MKKAVFLTLSFIMCLNLIFAEETKQKRTLGSNRIGFTDIYVSPTVGILDFMFFPEDQSFSQPKFLNRVGFYLEYDKKPNGVRDPFFISATLLSVGIELYSETIEDEETGAKFDVSYNNLSFTWVTINFFDLLSFGVGNRFIFGDTPEVMKDIDNGQLFFSVGFSKSIKLNI